MKIQRYYLCEYLQDSKDAVTINGVAQPSIDISIKDKPTQYEGKYLSEETKYWWKGLGEELEVDIEALDQNNSQDATT